MLTVRMVTDKIPTMKNIDNFQSQSETTGLALASVSDI